MIYLGVTAHVFDRDERRTWVFPVLSTTSWVAMQARISTESGEEADITETLRVIDSARRCMNPTSNNNCSSRELVDVAGEAEDTHM